MPSPYSSAAPKIPRRINQRRLAVEFGGMRAVSARIPPSPWLSARSTMAMYLTDTTSTSA